MSRRLQDIVVNSTGGGTGEASRGHKDRRRQGSMAQYAAQENATQYCAAKVGLDGLCKGAATELAPHNIRVNLGAPGGIFTVTNADIVDAVKKAGGTGCFFLHTPMGPREKVGEVSDVVAFLASDEASFVTGATWLVDDGFLSY